MKSIKPLESGAPSIKPIKPTRGSARAAPRRSSAPFRSITKRMGGEEGVANEAVIVRRGRCECMIEGRSERGMKIAAKGAFGSSTISGFGPCPESLLGANRCAKVSRYLVVVLNPIVRWLCISGSTGRILFDI